MVGPGQDPLEPWLASARVRVDEATLAAPAAAIAQLAEAWAERSPVIIELEVPNDTLRIPERTDVEPHDLPPSFEFERERLHHLVWANTYDARSGTPIWWHGRKAERLGATPTDQADVRLPDGRLAWCDGGPRGPVAGLAHPIVHRESIDMGTLHTSNAGAEPTADGLADDQRAAVAHSGGPARVIAPAGSGKTRTLTARLRHLVRDRWVEPELVTAVAYNAQAAAELRDRSDASAVSIRTIHSLAFAIVRAVRGQVDVADERRQRAILSSLIPRQPQLGRDITAAYLEALATVRGGLTPPHVVEESRDDIPGFTTVYADYRRHLVESAIVDFDDQVYEAIRALLVDPDLRRRVQRSCRHLLVDEFQDLTPAHLLLLRLVSAPGYQVFGVGDDDQVIYGYAGADPGFLVDFDALFPGAAHYALETNYRCPPPVVSSAATLLSYNRRRVEKRIRASDGRTGSFDIVRPTGLEQATEAGNIVQARLKAGARPTDIAVLCRVNHGLLPVQAILADRRIPHVAPVGIEFLQRTMVRAFLAYLRIGLAPDIMSRRDLEEVLSRPPRRITRAGRGILARKARWSLPALWAAADQLDDRTKGRFESFVADLELVTEAAAGTMSDLVDVIRRRIGLDQAAGLLDGSRSTPDRSGHLDDLDALAQLAGLHPRPATFEAYLEKILSDDGDPNGVILSTVHKVKGAEWPHVVVYGANRGSMPHQLATDVEEERRVFHVAITRGIETVAVIADAARPTRFLAEAAGTAPRTADRPAKVKPAEPATGGVVPQIGDRLTWGGHTGLVVEFGADGASIDVQGARVTVPWRERVRIGSISAPLAEPVGSADPELFELLRTWRSATAAEQNVPAYIVLSDRHLEGIAARRPTTPEELLGCPGIGPTKSETYGEAILEIIETYAGRPAAEPAG